MDPVEKSMEQARKTCREMKNMIKQGETILANYDAALAKLGHTSESLHQYVQANLAPYERVRYEKESAEEIERLRNEIAQEVSAQAMYRPDLSGKEVVIPTAKTTRKLSRSFV